MLGPLTNPAGAKGQIIGVFAAELTEPFAEVLRLLGSRRAFVVHGHDGMDELTTTTTTRISELRDGSVRTSEFDPLPFIEGFADRASLIGGDPAVNATITRSVLEGKPGPARDIVCLNAAAAIAAGGKAADIEEGWQLALNSIDNGKAGEALETMVAVSNA
jgi:anthranilate phosphoribosyltransferase